MKKRRRKAAGVPDVVHFGHIDAFPILFTLQSALGGWKAGGETEAWSSNPGPLRLLDTWLPLKPTGMKHLTFLMVWVQVKRSESHRTLAEMWYRKMNENFLWFIPEPENLNLYLKGGLAGGRSKHLEELHHTSVHPITQENKNYPWGAGVQTVLSAVTSPGAAGGPGAFRVQPWEHEQLQCRVKNLGKV